MYGTLARCEVDSALVHSLVDIVSRFGVAIVQGDILIIASQVNEDV